MCVCECYSQQILWIIIPPSFPGSIPLLNVTYIHFPRTCQLVSNMAKWLCSCGAKLWTYLELLIPFGNPIYTTTTRTWLSFPGHLSAAHINQLIALDKMWLSGRCKVETFFLPVISFARLTNCFFTNMWKCEMWEEQLCNWIHMKMIIVPISAICVQWCRLHLSLPLITSSIPPGN